ncbi:hypothetical protein EDC04DRAFT_2888410 [Pisolithus marmoratus]|nr:hypothetical protein EDC04DRAFT_2888410 [Pisolithus marmoratus]
MLHLKLPLEKWDYLEKHFGSIPRPESWVAAEQGMQQSSSQPEQSAASETTQGTCDSHDKTPNPPSSEGGSLDSSNNCTETESGYLMPESEVVDVQVVEDNLPVEEEGLLDSKNDWTEIPTGYLEPKTDIIDVQRTQLDEQPDTTSEHAKTQTGHGKPKDEVVDTWHIVDVLPMFEVGSTGQARYSKHVKELQASNEGSRRTSNKVKKSRDLPKSSSEVLKPAGNPTRQASRRSMQDGPQIPSKENQRTGMNSDTIADIPDPLGIHVETPAPHAKHSMLQNRPPA